MACSLKNKIKALDILKEYNGVNSYVTFLKTKIYVEKNDNYLNDMSIEYILNNHDKSPIMIGRMTAIASWFGQKLKETLGLEFVPEKLKIISIIGETKLAYYCRVLYRKSAGPLNMFIPKKAILKNFLYEDYSKLDIDFDKYDAITTAKDPNRKLKETQKLGVKFLTSRKKCLLADDMGYGKTTELIVAALEGDYDHVLIVCPASIKTNWRRELLWYVDEKDITIIDSINAMNKAEIETHLGYEVGNSNKKRDELIMEAKEAGKWKNNKFIIINFEILKDFLNESLATSRLGADKLKDRSVIFDYIFSYKSLIIVDEAHKLSKRTSIAYKIIKTLIKKGRPEGVFLATGTPITNNPINLYNILSFLDDPIVDDYVYYVERYCNGTKILAAGEKEKYTKFYLNMRRKKSVNELTDYEMGELKKYIWEHGRKITVPKGASNLEELELKVSHIYLRRIKEDIMGDIKKNVYELHYKLTPEEQNNYDNLWEEYIEESENDELNKDLLEGAIYRRYISDLMVPNTIKLVDKLISEGHKVIIGCCYDSELYSLQDYYKDKCVIYNGKMNAKKKDKSESKFMTDENVKVFIGNINAAGTGINLVAATKLVFNNMSFVPGDNKQFEDRIFRLGQKKDVDIFYQIFDNTQYEHMWDVVLKKTYIIDQIIKKEAEKQ